MKQKSYELDATIPDVLFITPPIWDVHLPYAAVPQLMGACKNAGLESMQIDFAILAFRIMFERCCKKNIDKFLTREYYENRVAVWKNSPVNTFDEYLEKVAFLSNPDFGFEIAKATFNNGGLLEKGIISALIDSVLASYSAKSSTGVFNVAESFEQQSSKIIDECIAQCKLLALLQQDIKLVGISVTGIIQLRFTKEVIDALRVINPFMKIVLGGNAITLAVRSNFSNAVPLLELSDFLLIGEGETSIVHLAQYCLGNQSNLSEIPGLIYKTEEGIMSNPTNLEDIETVSKPCFDGVNFNQYVLPEPMFPYHTSRGCFYGQCAFCDHDPEYRHNYRQKSVRKVVSEILELAKQTGLRNVQFTDEAIEPGFFREMVLEMERTPEFHDIFWLCYLRVSRVYDEETVRLAAKNGCRMVLFGIETFQQRLLNFIKKGQDAQTAKENLRLFHRHGIKTFSWFMFGLPSETIVEALSDVKTIQEISENLDGFYNGSFRLSPNTDMSRDTAKYNIIDYDAYDGLSFATHNDGNLVDVKKVREAYRSKITSFKRSNYFSSDRYVLYYDDAHKYI